jgi:TM2 domain-containing membrane protein YozV
MSNCAKHPDVAASAYCRTCGKAVCSSCARDVRGVVYCEECLAARVGDTMPPRGANVMPPPGVAPADPGLGGGHPGLAAILGFIPGVGAMYNGQFVKGFIHVLIFITFIWLGSNVSGFFGVLVAAWVFYMVFDAYETAKAMKYGLPLPDPFGINNLAGGITNEAAYARRMHEAGERIGQGFSTAASAFNHVGTDPAPGGTPPQQPYPGTAQDPYTPTSQQAYVAPVMPQAPPPAREVTPAGAVILIILGVLFLLGNFTHLHLDRWWPILLIGVGVWLFIRRQQQQKVE